MPIKNARLKEAEGKVYEAIIFTLLQELYFLIEAKILHGHTVLMIETCHQDFLVKAFCRTSGPGDLC